MDTIIEQMELSTPHSSPQNTPGTTFNEIQLTTKLNMHNFTQKTQKNSENIKKYNLINKNINKKKKKKKKNKKKIHNKKKIKNNNKINTITLRETQIHNISQQLNPQIKHRNKFNNNIEQKTQATPNNTNNNDTITISPSKRYYTNNTSNIKTNEILQIPPLMLIKPAEKLNSIVETIHHKVLYPTKQSFNNTIDYILEHQSINDTIPVHYIEHILPIGSKSAKEFTIWWTRGINICPIKQNETATILIFPSAPTEVEFYDKDHNGVIYDLTEKQIHLFKVQQQVTTVTTKKSSEHTLLCIAGTYIHKQGNYIQQTNNTTHYTHKNRKPKKKKSITNKDSHKIRINPSLNTKTNKAHIPPTNKDRTTPLIYYLFTFYYDLTCNLTYFKILDQIQTRCIPHNTTSNNPDPFTTTQLNTTQTRTHKHK